MRGTSYTNGFGIATFFFLGGIVMFLLGGELFPTGTLEQDLGGAGDTFRMIGGIWAGVGLLLLIFFAALRTRGSRRARIAATGDPGTAIVRGAEQTGTYVNMNPQFKLTLELGPDSLVGGRQVERKAIVPMTALGRFGLGTELPIRFHREKPEDFEIVWDELPAPDPQQAARTDTRQRLEELDRLRKEGAITSAEYEAKRKQVLAEL